jgi:hypothetical protein
LRARDIIPHVPEPETYGGLKRERSATPEIVDVDQLETDDDEIQIIKHMVSLFAQLSELSTLSLLDTILFEGPSFYFLQQEAENFNNSKHDQTQG